jgi:hypothetical protein
MSLSKNLNLLTLICKIEIISLEDVDSIVNTTDRYHVAVTLKSGKSWTQVYFTPGTEDLSIKVKDNDAGIISELSFKSVFPGVADGNFQSFDSFTDRPLLVKFHCSTGEKILLGRLGNGAKLNVSRQLSYKSSGSVLEISWSYPTPYALVSD